MDMSPKNSKVLLQYGPLHIVLDKDDLKQRYAEASGELEIGKTELAQKLVANVDLSVRESGRDGMCLDGLHIHVNPALLGVDSSQNTREKIQQLKDKLDEKGVLSGGVTVDKIQLGKTADLTIKIDFSQSDTSGLEYWKLSNCTTDDQLQLRFEATVRPFEKLFNALAEIVTEHANGLAEKERRTTALNNSVGVVNTLQTQNAMPSLTSSDARPDEREFSAILSTSPQSVQVRDLTVQGQANPQQTKIG